MKATGLPNTIEIRSDQVRDEHQAQSRLALAEYTPKSNRKRTIEIYRAKVYFSAISSSPIQ